MNNIDIDIRELKREVVYYTSRSSGPGGQNVNKVNSKVELRFDIQNSTVLTDNQKIILLEKLSAKISSNGILTIISQKERSQLLNKEDAFEKLCNLLIKAFKPVKKRKQTRPTKASVEKRLSEKKIQSEKKSFRGRIT